MKDAYAMKLITNYTMLRIGTQWCQQHPTCPKCSATMTASEAWDEFDFTILGFYCESCGRLWEDVE